MVRPILLLAPLALVGCIQPPPVERYPVDVPDDAPPAGDPYQPGGQPGAVAGGGTSGYDPYRSSYQEPPPQSPQTQNPGQAQQPTGFPASTEFGLVFGRNSAWVQSRTRVRSGSLVDAGIYFTEDDFVFDLGFIRMGAAAPNSPLVLGAGIGFQAGSLDEPIDFVSAISLTALAAYYFDSQYRTRLMGQVSFAPDVTTFGDADALVDARAGVEFELGEFASVMVGYRFYEWGVDSMDGEDVELEDGAFFGVRLAF